ncbi:translation termination factor GTPase eRF3, partial [Cladochytrium tenue]
MSQNGNSTGADGEQQRNVNRQFQRMSVGGGPAAGGGGGPAFQFQAGATEFVPNAGAPDFVPSYGYPQQQQQGYGYPQQQQQQGYGGGYGQQGYYQQQQFYGGAPGYNAYGGYGYNNQQGYGAYGQQQPPQQQQWQQGQGGFYQQPRPQRPPQQQQAYTAPSQPRPYQAPGGQQRQQQGGPNQGGQPRSAAVGGPQDAGVAPAGPAKSISIGAGGNASGPAKAISIGAGGNAGPAKSISIGAGGNAGPAKSISIGASGNSTPAKAISIGAGGGAGPAKAISIGAGGNAGPAKSISIGAGGAAGPAKSISIGSPKKEEKKAVKKAEETKVEAPAAEEPKTEKSKPVEVKAEPKEAEVAPEPADDTTTASKEEEKKAAVTEPAPEPVAEEEEEDLVPVEDKDNTSKDHLNIVFIGHVDAGKSTMGGHILFLTGMVDKRTMEKYEKEAKELGRESWYLSWALDLNQEERNKGKTVEYGRGYFETAKRRFTVLDAPGHKNYVPSMMQAAAQADVVILVISARKGEFETGFEKGGQTREHAMLAKTVGVKRLIMVVNKMDDPTVKWDKARYDECVSKILPFLKGVGYKPKVDLDVMPISGFTGANLKDRLSKDVCPWYDGPSLLELLDEIDIGDRQINGPLLMPISDKFKDMGTIVTGKIESG